MTTDQHDAVRKNDHAQVVGVLGDAPWTCWESRITSGPPATTSSSWYTVKDGTKFWAFVNNGLVTSTTLLKN